MLTKRLITVLLLNDGVLYRTRNFVPDYRYTSNFVDAWSVDEVVILDITRPYTGSRNNFIKSVNQLAQQCFVPLAVGGGIRDLDDVSKLLKNGADKVILNTGAIQRPELITEVAKTYGSQCAVVCLDTKRVGETYHVQSDFGTVDTKMSATCWASQCQELGAGEIFIQSIERDGMLEGYELELAKQVVDVVDIPVLLCSGAGNWQHFVDALEFAKVDAVCTSNIYHFTETSIKSAKQYMADNNINMRIG